MKLLKTTLALLATFSLSASAAIVLAWDVSGHNSPDTLIATTIADNIEQSSDLNELSRTGVTSNTGANSYNSKGWNTTNTFEEDKKYISFTVSPESGYEVTYESLSYVMEGSNSAPNTGRWGYSIDGGSFVLQDTFTVKSSTTGAWDFADFTTDKSVEFRYWSYGTTSINGGTSGTTGTTRIANKKDSDDLILNGSVSIVPEPGSAALIGSFAFLGLLRRRRMR